MLSLPLHFDRPLLSIILPTFNEAGNIGPLLDRIERSMQQTTAVYEVIFVDDSTDETPDVINREIARRYDLLNGIYFRVQHRRVKNGLSGAILSGFRMARGVYVLVMDADLQHPPETIPAMLAALEEGAEIVVPTRYNLGGSEDFTPYRRALSRGGAGLARLLVPKLRAVQDCTGGFFALRREIIPGDLEAIGWKMLIEILARADYTRVVEIPYHFGERAAGHSKLNMKVQLDYLVQLTRLSPHAKRPAIIAFRESYGRFVRYALVGGLGVLINLIVFAILTHITTNIELASGAASGAALLLNYALNYNFTWADRGVKRWRSALLYPLIALLGVYTTAVLSYSLDVHGTPLILGQMIGVFVSSLWTFIAQDKIAFRPRAKPRLDYDLKNL